LTKRLVYITIHYMIYNRVALIRTEAGMSRQQLADAVGVNYQTIGFIERGDYLPSLELAFKIAEVFHTDVPMIFSNKPFESLFKKQGVQK
jgi:putative transcriptional regulator